MQSVFPPSREGLEKIPDLLPSLIAANGTPIRTYGTTTRAISILGHRSHWTFVIADVKFPLLGADFLGHHRLLVNVARQRLLDTGTCHPHQLSTRPRMPSICSVAPNSYTSSYRNSRMCSNQNCDSHLGLRQSMASSTTSLRRAHQPMPSSEAYPPRSYKMPNGLSQKWNAWAFVKRHQARGRPLSTWSPEEHLRHVHAVVKRLQGNGLVVRFDKCIFGKEKVNLLGHKVSPAGVWPTASKV
ncbi:uncharacterized protein [Macrobrachium rosenbergii]|uniref:uncharacterized protein n=1 Tax=Macrobrachium rosenbergii TaxID=79674 RepID=UPI0034D62F97